MWGHPDLCRDASHLRWGILCLCSLGVAVHKANSGKMSRVFKGEAHKIGTEQPKGVILKADLAVFTVSGLVQLIYP